MGLRNVKTDEYIAKAAPFARPMLEQLRAWVHEAAPDDLTETIKWGMPCFEYKGIVANIAAFKNHCSFGFWKGKLLQDTQGLINQVGETGMGHFGKMQTIADLPAETVFKSYVQEAIALNKQQIAAEPKKTFAQQKEIETPDYLANALEQAPEAKQVYDNFSYSNKKEYVEWLEDAKTENTRMKRLATTLEWLAAGKPRNWKYMKQWKGA